MSIQNPYHNPYEGTPKDRLSRVNANIDTNDFNFIRSIRLADGTIQTTVNILWSKLVYACKQRGINDLTKQSEFEHFVANLILSLPGDTQAPIHNGATGVSGGSTRESVGSRNPAKESSRDVRRGASSVREGNSRTKKQ